LYQTFKWQYVAAFPQGKSFEQVVDVTDFILENISVIKKLNVNNNE